MSLLAKVVAHLRARSIPHALIGAAAMAVRGVSRSTFDIDLLVTDRTTLLTSTWSALAEAGVAIELHVGDTEDPLAGVIRLEREARVDVVVGRGGWQKAVLARATLETFDSVTTPVVTVADLILLKLYAGGPQDMWDARQLLAGPDQGNISMTVEAELSSLPSRARDAWAKVSEGLRAPSA